jgi:hypothetical protein
MKSNLTDLMKTMHGPYDNELRKRISMRFSTAAGESPARFTPLILMENVQIRRTILQNQSRKHYLEQMQ